MLAVCGFALSANAQYYNKILLFIEVGKTIDDAYSIIYLHFDDDGKMWKTSLSKRDAQDKYAKGILEEYGVNQTHEAKRDYSISSSKYQIYSGPSYAPNHNMFGLPDGTYYINGTNYYAIEYGSDGLVYWWIYKNENEPKGKKYYKAIKPSDLAIKAPDYTFLN
jgi:hypothetical protein